MWNNDDSIGHELIRTELRYTEPKLERIDYYATTYECHKETEDPPVHQGRNSCTDPGELCTRPVLQHDVMYYKYVMSMPRYTVRRRTLNTLGKDQPADHGQLDHLLRRNYFANVNICTETVETPDI